MCVCVCEELHSQLLAVETDMNNKNKELQTLHSSLTEAMVSKERLEQRVVELMEMSQHSLPDDSLQARVQVSRRTNDADIHLASPCYCTCGFLREAEQHSGFVYQELVNENKDLQVQNERMQAQIAAQVYLFTSVDA